MSNDDTSASTGPSPSYSFPDSSAPSQSCAITHSVPIDQPEQVHQLTSALFAPYEVDGGTMSLGGCLLEEVPFLRVEVSGWVTEDEDEGAASGEDPGDPPTMGEQRSVQRWSVFDTDGNEIAQAIAHSLGLDYPQPVDAAPPTVKPSEIRSWLVPLTNRLSDQFEQNKERVTRCEIVWCKRASGKLVVQIADQTAAIPFAGWARTIASGVEMAPEFKCPLTGRTSYRITSTESGELTVPEAMKKCAVSGQRVLESDLQACQVTQRLCLPEYLSECEISGKRVMKDRVVACAWCDQQVDNGQIDQGRCRTCHSLSPLAPNAESLQALCDRYPGLRRFKSWSHQASPTCDVFEGKTLFKRLVVSIEKNSNEIRQIATGSRIGRILTPVPKPQWQDLLQSANHPNNQ